MQLPDYFEFMCPVKTSSGYRALEHIPMDLSLLDARRPLIVTEKRHSDHGLVKKLAAAFNGSGLSLGVYDGVNKMPGLETVKELYGLYRDKGFDSIIALGCGMVVDVAKVLNIAVSGEMDDIKTSEGTDHIRKPLRPLVLVPVSSGTGKETSGETVFCGRNYSSKFLMPDMAVIDPRMMTDEAPVDIVSTAFTALTYAAESYACTRKNPFSNTYARLAVGFVMNNLPAAVENALAPKGKLKALIQDDSKKTAQVALANGSCMAGYVYSNMPQGLAVKIARAVSECCGVPEGLAVGILLPYVLEYHAAHEADGLSNLLLPMAGLEMYSVTPEHQRLSMAIGKIRNLQNNLFSITGARIPRTLEDLKLPKDMLPGIALKANGGSDVHDCLKILEHAYSGRPITPMKEERP